MSEADVAKPFEVARNLQRLADDTMVNLMRVFDAARWPHSLRVIVLDAVAEKAANLSTMAKLEAHIEKQRSR